MSLDLGNSSSALPAPSSSLTDDGAPAAVAFAAPVDRRPVCPYGNGCYRLNPDHLKTKRHVHLEQFLSTTDVDLERSEEVLNEAQVKQVEILKELRRKEEKDKQEVVDATVHFESLWGMSSRNEDSPTEPDSFFSRHQDVDHPKNPSERSPHLPFTRKTFEQLFRVRKGKNDRERK